MIEDADITEPEHGTDNPAGEVFVPPSRREVARTRALAGMAIGLSAVLGVAAWTTPSSTTSITA